MAEARTASLLQLLFTWFAWIADCTSQPFEHTFPKQHLMFEIPFYFSLNMESQMWSWNGCPAVLALVHVIFCFHETTISTYSTTEYFKQNNYTHFIPSLSWSIFKHLTWFTPNLIKLPFYQMKHLRIIDLNWSNVVRSRVEIHNWVCL